MRHLTAVQPLGQTGWHYASTTDRGGHPLGYCPTHKPHDTETQARECYSRWLRDHVTLGGHSNWQACAVCDAATKRYASVNGDWTKQASLCEKHLTVEHAVKAMHLDEPAGDQLRS